MSPLGATVYQSAPLKTCTHFSLLLKPVTKPQLSTNERTEEK